MTLKRNKRSWQLTTCLRAAAWNGFFSSKALGCKSRMVGSMLPAQGQNLNGWEWKRGGSNKDSSINWLRYPPIPPLETKMSRNDIESKQTQLNVSKWSAPECTVFKTHSKKETHTVSASVVEKYQTVKQNKLTFVHKQVCVNLQDVCVR